MHIPEHTLQVQVTHILRVMILQLCYIVNRFDAVFLLVSSPFFPYFTSFPQVVYTTFSTHNL